MNFISRLFVIFLSLMIISGCKIRSIHSHNYEINNQLGEIEILPVDSIYGAEYYDRLKQYLEQSGTKFSSFKYQLISNLSYSKSIAILMENSDITSNKGTLKVSYKLINKETLEILTEGEVTVRTLQNSTFEPFSNSVIEEDSYHRLARDAAKKVFDKLMLNFAK